MVKEKFFAEAMLVWDSLGMVFFSPPPQVHAQLASPHLLGCSQVKRSIQVITLKLQLKQNKQKNLKEMSFPPVPKCKEEGINTNTEMTALKYTK